MTEHIKTFRAVENLPSKQRIDNLTRTASHQVFLGLVDSLFDLEDGAMFDTLADSLDNGAFEEEDLVGLITNTFDFMGISESLQDDMLSDDDDIAKASLREIADFVVDNFEDETVESLSDILQDSFLEDWKTFLRKGHSEGEKRVASGGAKHKLVKSHVGKTATFTSVPVSGKGKKPRGRSSTRKRKKGVPAWRKIQARGWARDKKRERESDTREDSFIIVMPENVEVLSDSIIDEMSTSERVDYIEVLSDSIGNVFYDDLSLSDIIDDEFYLSDSKGKRRKKSDCNHKQDLVKVCSAKSGKCKMSCRVKPEYAGKIKRGTSPLKGRRRKKSDIAKQQKSQKFRSMLGI